MVQIGESSPLHDSMMLIYDAYRGESKIEPIEKEWMHPMK